MKKTQAIFLTLVWMLLLSNSVCANPPEFEFTPSDMKPLNYASFFITYPQHQPSQLQDQSDLKFMTQASSEEQLGYDIHAIGNTDGVFSISPYWFYILKIIVLLGVLMWDDQDQAKLNRKSGNN